jgi:putative transposase
MARLARAVAPGVPHHVTQRGNRRETTFFRRADYVAYRRLLATWCRQCGVEVWAYCLMPNHVHLLLVPADADALGRALGETHRRYTRAVNQRQGWVGHLWQGLFSSCALGPDHVLASARYIELNPVRARLVARPEDWPWSSARAHLARRADWLMAATTPLLDEAGDWATFLASGLDDPRLDAVRRHERTGRPLGSEAFVADLDQRAGRLL